MTAQIWTHVRPSSPERARWRTRCGFAVAFFAVLVPRFADGNDRSRLIWTMGRYIEHSAVIALADAKTGTTTGHQSVLELREALKGRVGASERTIAIKWDCLEGGPALIPPGSKGVAVLLAEGWQGAECPLMEAYQKPAEVAALRSLIRIYALPSERSRLEALRALLNDPNPLFGDQLFDDLKQMREPANFQIVLDVYNAGDTAGQRNALLVLAVIGDLRGVPTLLEALTSADPTLRESAEAILSAQFRGAPGVDEALRQVKHSPQPPSPRRQRETRFQAATGLWESGRRERGRLLFLAVAGDRSESDYVRVRSALTIGSRLSQSERDALQAAMRPLLVRFVARTNYLEGGALQEAAEILRALRSQKNLDLLMALFDPRQHDFVHQHTHYIATQAIRELGPMARRRAAERLVARIDALRKTENVKGNRVSAEPAATLLALAWLGDPDQLEKIEDWRWGQLRPLLGVGQQQDEGLFLVRVLQNYSDLSPLAHDWILFRLGELREQRAVTRLMYILATRDTDPTHIPNALVKIAGPVVESEATKLLTSPRPEAREAAMQILYPLQGARMLPLLRRMMVEQDFGVKSRALEWIGVFGEPDDLTVLIPMADFWTGDRANYGRARGAVAEIRRRHHYDLGGPILPPAPRPPAPRPPA